MNLGEFIPTPNSKLVLHFNGNSNDSSGNGLNGTDTNVLYSKNYGKFNEGVRFTYSYGERISFGADPVLVNFTYLAWVYVPALKGTAITIKSGYSSNSQNGCPQFRIEANGKLGLIKSYVAAIAYSTDVVATNAWNRVAVTFAAGGVTKFYINGKYAGGGTNNQSFNQKNLLIGINSEAGGWYEPFNGNVDEFVIENRVWTAIEFQNDYTYSLGRFAIL